MKNLKKIMAAVLVVMMIGAMAVTAYAYSITVTNTNTAHVTIAGKTYSAYKLFDMTYAGMSGSPANGSGTAYAYTIDSDGDGSWAWNDIKGTADANGVYTNSTYGLTFTPSAGDNTVYSVTSTMTDAQARALADTLQSKRGSASVKYEGSVATGAETVKINTNDPGYYLVYGTATAVQGESGSADVIAAVSLTSTNPDVTINPKVDAPTVEKVIQSGTTPKGTDVQIGDTVSFKVTSAVPADMNGYKSGTKPYVYKFHDTMSSGLTFDPNSVSVKIGSTTLASSAYTLTKPDGVYTFSITIQDMTIYTPGDAVDITYSATVNSNALKTETETNTVTLEYSNNPYGSGTGETTEKKVYVYDFDIEVEKYDAESSGTKLEGAKFVLKNSDNKYYVNNSGTVSWVDNQASGTVIETAPGTGKAKFQGLDVGTYQMIEIEAPEGYNLLQEPVPVTITAIYDSGTGELTSGSSVNIGSNQQLYQTKPVENRKGSLLPSTGGIGTTIFYVVGAVLVIGSGIVLVTKKRMGKEEN